MRYTSKLIWALRLFVAKRTKNRRAIRYNLPKKMPNHETEKAFFLEGFSLLSLTQATHYLKKESTNSYLLKTCKSSKPSPTPIYFTGI